MSWMLFRHGHSQWGHTLWRKESFTWSLREPPFSEWCHFCLDWEENLESRPYNSTLVCIRLNMILRPITKRRLPVPWVRSLLYYCYWCYMLPCHPGLHWHENAAGPEVVCSMEWEDGSRPFLLTESVWQTSFFKMKHLISPAMILFLINICWVSVGTHRCCQSCLMFLGIISWFQGSELHFHPKVVCLTKGSICKQ
jgi:hypothetical protein